MKISHAVLAVILLAVIDISPSFASGRSIRIDNPGAPGCQILNWSVNIKYYPPTLGPYPFPFTMFNPLGFPVALQPGTDNGTYSVAGCGPAAGSDFSTDPSDLNSVFEVNQTGGAVMTNESYVADLNAHSGSPSWCYPTGVGGFGFPCYLASNGELYSFIVDSPGDNSPGTVVAQVVVWTLNNGDIEIELDSFCSQSGPGYSFSWSGVSYSGGCNSTTNDFLFNGSGILIGYVNDSSPSSADWTVTLVKNVAAPPGWSPMVLIAPVLSSVTASNASTTLNWEPTPGATGYDVYFSQLPGGESYPPLTSSTTTTAQVFSGQPFETIYFYRVAAVYNGLSSPLSNELASVSEENSLLNGIFQNAILGFVNTAPVNYAPVYSFSSVQETQFFDGVGTMDGNEVTNVAGTVAMSSVARTYIFSPGGTFSMYGTGGFLLNGALSADGNTLLEANISNLPSVSVGIRLGSVNSLNTPSGILALNSNTTGYDNAALGAYSMFSNTTGYANSAVGYDALYANVSGANNNAQGGYALYSNTTGYGNSAVGVNALKNLTTGFRNVAIGNNTGLALQGGSYNVDIGWGVSGAGDETGVMRIGSPSFAQQTYIAGITNSQVTGAPVYVTASGQLGVLASSERYKTDIAPLPSDNERLLQLQPVTFHLKSEPNGALQYGLIAEQVEKVYPELVLRDAQGQLQGVRYDELAPILLSQVQQQQQTIAAQDSGLAEAREQIAAQAEDVRELERELADLKRLNEVANRGTPDREAQDQ